MQWFDRYKLFRNLGLRPRTGPRPEPERGDPLTAGFIFSPRLNRQIEVLRKKGETAQAARARVAAKHT
jgi:hypothetical protein